MIYVNRRYLFGNIVDNGTNEQRKVEQYIIKRIKKFLSNGLSETNHFIIRADGFGFFICKILLNLKAEIDKKIIIEILIPSMKALNALPAEVQSQFWLIDQVDRVTSNWTKSCLLEDGAIEYANWYDVKFEAIVDRRNDMCEVQNQYLFINFIGKRTVLYDPYDEYYGRR